MATKRAWRAIWWSIIGAVGCQNGGEPQPVPSAVQLGVVTAPSASAQSGVALPVQPVIELQDGQGHSFALAGRNVTVSLTAAGAALSGTLTIKTDNVGRAAFTNLALSGPAGAWTLRFESPGLRAVTAAPIQLGAGLPVVLTPVSGNLQTTVAGTAVAILPAVRVTDAAGNAVAGVPVEFSASAGGSVEGAQASSGSNGLASPTKWTLATAIGLNTLTVTSSALPGVSVSFTATGTVGPPATLTVVGGGGQTATVGGLVPTPPSVKLTDAAGHLLPGVAITFTAGQGGAVTGNNPLTDADGIATLGGWSLGLAPGPNTLTASRSGVPSVTFDATGLIFAVSALAVGDFHACALDPAGAAWCWGSNQNGQLGQGVNGGRDSVPRTVSGNLIFSAIAAGETHSCGILTNGDAYCWGSNDNGELGDGTSSPRNVPTAVAGGFKFTAIDAGLDYTCGLVQGGAGAVRCWGLGTDGQLGDGTVNSRNTPTLVGGGHSFASISTGAAHTCGLEAGGTGVVFCWGTNPFGRLGDGTTTNRVLPTPVAGSVSFASVAAGSTHTCGVSTAGAGYCWGRGLSGRLGTGNLLDQTGPAAVSGGLTFQSISASAGQSCGLTTTGAAYCWGFNGSGELGDGSFTNRSVPTAVQGGLTFTLLVAGAERTCGRSSAGGAYCWGRNDGGAVGDGTFEGKQKPVGVFKP